MIDLSYKPRKEKPKEEPLGLVILGLLPFAVLFYVVLTAGFMNGIF